ncbi:MAG: VF530 family DNA-binding protein [Bdellovibrionales bacterium]
MSDPLEGKTLEFILTELVEKIGFEEMGKRVKIRCFNNDPSIKSSLKFLRKTPWAREKTEDLYLYEVLDIFTDK